MNLGVETGQIRDVQGDLSTLFAQARDLHASGDLAEANRLYGDIIGRAPHHADALHMRGLLALQVGHPEPAVALISRAIALAPAGLMHHNRAAALARLDRFDDALADYTAAVALQPDLVQTLAAHGKLLSRLGRGEDAAALYASAIARFPHDAALHFAAGEAHRSAGRAIAALEAFDHAIALAPGFLAAHMAKGDLLAEQGRLAAALTAFDDLLAVDSANAVAHFNRGVMLRKLGRTDEAIAANEAAIARAPDFAKAHQQLAICLLQKGDLARGLAEYEWRRRTSENADPRYALPSPWWGEDLTGRTLYIFPELYLGDMIQFCRYAVLAEQRGAQVVLAAPRALHTLLRSLSPTLTLIDASQAPERVDYQCALLSLPKAFGAAIPAQPYLAAEPALIEQWRDKIGGRGFKIGVCWQGSTLPYADAMQRSYPLAELAPLAACADARLISLQKYSGLDQLDDLPPGMAVEVYRDFDDGENAFVDTAAMMAACDLIVTADTSVAHLAGALGIPVWLALPWLADWRWLETGETSAWYPSMRLFRQPAPGDWQSVFDAMAKALAAR